eukprot:gnl/Spiro4/13994_TR7501_c0_g1_i1.p1 gnl/Spiro4/13994_TR7501_c0_g1~~gnl/Spiro4/13994_TR7501_c0_g1_i1.p1  ORF type:complete len:658 (+),score=77.35 gnl/Spiro4/13994_TR7501_c0_g1_i1:86-2059(+)
MKAMEAWGRLKPRVYAEQFKRLRSDQIVLTLRDEFPSITACIKPALLQKWVILALTNEEPSEPRAKRSRTVSHHRLSVSDARQHSKSWRAASSVRFADVGGIEECLQEIRLLIEFPFLVPQLFDHLGGQSPRGILIHGPPGCGKTFLASAIAGELSDINDIVFLRVSAPELIAGTSGESEANIRLLFSEATNLAPCLVFIDEIDAIAAKRDSAQREMEKRVVAQLLTCLDDVTKNSGTVIVISASNRPDALDPALRRRFDREISMGMPDAASRTRILRVVTAKMRLHPTFDFETLAKCTVGYVGADLAALAKEAAMSAVCRIVASLHEPDLRTATEKLSSAFSSLTDESELALENMTVLMDDFVAALDKVTPAARREGFATVPDVTFADIGALDDVRSALDCAIVDPILHPDKYRAFGIQRSTGVLLHGPPGCGKTMLAKAVANATHASFISVKGPELLNKFVGESERAVRQLFERARASSPCIVFFDELDALCPSRGLDGSAVTDRVVNQLLTEMDGLEKRELVFVIAATNRPDIIDPAMLRPGRLDRLLFVPLPRAQERAAILRNLTKNTPLGDDVDIDLLAHHPLVDGFSGADLAGLVRQASVLAAHAWGRASSAEVPTVSAHHFENALATTTASVSKEASSRSARFRQNRETH